MAEILLRVISKTNADPALDKFCTKRGDVIAVQADGWVWGSEELANPDWRIIKLPGLDPALLLGLLEPEIVTGPRGLNPSILRKRIKYLDIDSLSNQVKDKIMNATAPLTFTVAEQTALRALEKIKPALQVTAG